jgi:hypothetical protein
VETTTVSSYQYTLQKCFSYSFQAPKKLVMEAVNNLLHREDDVSSSFAVTSDAPEGYLNLRLSVASYEYLVREGII